MKYLTYIKTSEDFLRVAKEYVNSLGDNIIRSDLHNAHCTIMLGIFDEAEESMIEREFMTIAPSQVKNTRVKNLELFDKGSLVARLDDTTGYLRRIHYSIIQTLARFLKRDELEFPEQYRTDIERVRAYNNWGSPYAGEMYQPHVTLCRIKPESNRLLTNPFIGIEWATNEVHLAKKIEKSWVDITKVELK